MVRMEEAPLHHLPWILKFLLLLQSLRIVINEIVVVRFILLVVSQIGIEVRGVRLIMIVPVGAWFDATLGRLREV